MRIIDVEQGSPEWFKVRCGLPTASNFDKLITSTGKPSKQKEKYLYKTAGEYITGIPEEGYQSQAMIRGNELEQEARSFYEMVKGVTVQQVGFCIEDETGSGCSPDGLVGEDGLIQIKCPSLAVHVEYLLSDKIETAYFEQVQGEMYVTGRKWNDLVSYYPGMKPLIIRVKRDETFINALKTELKTFNRELKEIIKKLGD